MSRPKNIQDAIDNASLLLIRKDYQTLEAISNISRIFLAQALVLELRQEYHLTFIQIGEGVGVDEKTVRYDWLDANHCIESENLVALAKFYLKMRANYV
jgi:hypothetical protein